MTVTDKDRTFISKLWALTNRAKKMHKDEREMTLLSVDMIGEISGLRPWQYLSLSQESYLKYIGLTPSKYAKRRRVYLLFKKFPRARAMFEAGETEISHLVAIAKVITKENAEVVLEAIKHKSKREVEEFAARVRPDGSIDNETAIHEILLFADEELLQLFNRSREVMMHGGQCPKNAEIVKKALKDYLKAHDPMQKAERWAKKAEGRPNRSEDETIEGSIKKEVAPGPTNNPKLQWGQFPRKAIPAAIRHRVWLRDGGRCTYVHADGGRCEAKSMLEIDHIHMVCRGGNNSENNLRLICRFHNQQAASEQIGRTIYRQPGASRIGIR